MPLPSLITRGRRHLPLPRGRYTVGCADIITSFSKSGAFVRLFYPSEETNIEEHYLEWPLFVPNKEYITGTAIRAGIYPAIYEWLYPWLAGEVFIPAVWQGRINQNDSTFPVIVFSHGLSGWRCSYSTICTELASHGFVIASVEHRDNSASASFYLRPSRMSAYGPYPSSYLEDVDKFLKKEEPREWTDAVEGHWEPTEVPQNVGPLPYTKEWILYERVDGKDEISFRRTQVGKRAEECTQALDMLESLNNGTFTMNLLDPNFRAESFKGRLDTKNPAIVGHSFGGATCILALASDQRFRAGVALDPWMFPLKKDTDSFSRISQPLLAICTDHFQDAESLDRLKELKSRTTTNECEVLKIRKSEHRDQSDVPFIGGFLLRKLMKVNSHAVAFRSHYLTCEMTIGFLSKCLGLDIDYKESNSDVKKEYVVDCLAS